MLKIYKNLFIYPLYTMQKYHIQLTPKEESIFNMLIQYQKEIATNTVLRVAGGWVRDKLMAIDSHDIDIALDNMMGEEFVTKLKQHSEGKKDKISGLGVTKFNPDLSKHLETATAQINDLSIDFVNLRSEKYNPDSRIPVIEFGTPKEDAERRDFTINSLFYNLNTSEIEDWTQKGFADLQDKILRTPLQPYITFKDDPLRILRCLRFKSRFSFTVHQSIYEAMERPEIKEALLHKVSKQRIGKQLQGILKSKNPLDGLKDLLKYDLWRIVFQIPTDSNLVNQELIKAVPLFSFTLLQQFLSSILQNKFLTAKDFITEEEINRQNKKKVTYQSAQFQLMFSLSCLTYIYHKYEVKVGKTKINLITFIIKDQLKYSAKHAKFCYHSAEAVRQLQQINTLDNIFPLIRWLRFAEQKWQLCLHMMFAIKKMQKSEAMISTMEIRDFILKNQLEWTYLKEGPVDGNFFKGKGVKGKNIGTGVENGVIWAIVNKEKGKEEFIKEFEQNPDFFLNGESYR